jgi:hypothetical protein
MDGQVFFDGDVYTSTSYSSSDVKLKNKINDFNNSDALGFDTNDEAEDL